MGAEIRRFGNSQSPVLIVDEFSRSVERVAELADALAPFPAADGSFYPGVRRLIGPTDSQAGDYVRRTCSTLVSVISSVFGIEAFALLEASFSIVTKDPSQLSLAQRSPHFDSTDPGYLAVLHYLRVSEGTGTAFFRQRTTGIEVVTELNKASFVATTHAEVPQLAQNDGYMVDSNRFFEKIGEIDAVPDRLIVYRGSSLHSGIIRPGMTLSADPRLGRLTANIFLLGQ